MKVPFLLFLLTLAVLPYTYAQPEASATPEAAQPAPLISAEGARYQQALRLGFYHEAYRRCSREGDLSRLYDLTRQSLNDSTSAAQSNRLTDLLYQEMAGHALGSAMKNDSDSQRCAAAGETYRQLRGDGAPAAMKSFFGIELPAPEDGGA